MLLATLAGGLVYFLLGWVMYGMLLADVFVTPESITKEFVVWSMFLSCIIWALLLAIIQERWANARSFSTGAVVGGVVGFLSSAAVDFGMYSMYNFMTIQGSLGDMVVNGILSAITGGVIGLILGAGRPRI